LDVHDLWRSLVGISANSAHPIDRERLARLEASAESGCRGETVLRLRTGYLLVVWVAALLSAIAPVWAADAFVSRDQWGPTTAAFRNGYVLGIQDVLQPLRIYSVAGPIQIGVPFPEYVRQAHACIRHFYTMREAVNFGEDAINRQSEPRASVALVIYRALLDCDATKDYGQNFGSAGVTAYVSKDRWDKEVEPHLADFADGYIAGLTDLLRGLDNAGKSAPVLTKDVQDASICSTKLNTGRPVSMAALVGFVNRSVAAPGYHDPQQSMAAAIFEALRVCKVK